MKQRPILIVDDEPEIRQTLFDGLSTNGYAIFLAENGEGALRLFEQRPFDLIVLDVKLPDRDGIQLLETMKNRSAETPVIMMSGYGTTQNAIEAMRRGAFDYLLKPFSVDTIKQRIQVALKESLVRAEVRPEVDRPEMGRSETKDGLTSSSPIITRDKRMLELMEVCQRVAASKATVLIQGESGTGKELYARYIHARSPQCNGPFVAVNCASLPETLFESELFGHEKGAFTGALGRKIGKFELAHGGTLLLDEISEMSPFLQAKILRVLQEGEVDRVGGKEPIPVDVRVIATTNRDLEACIKKGEFREDLYYRLNIISFKLPPLRERAGDVDLLVNHFLGRYAEQYNSRARSISERAWTWLRKQPWQGNVRQLKNLMERAILMASGPVLDLADFSATEQAGGGAPEGQGAPVTFSLREMEKNLIFRALEQTNGNRTHAARMLGISIRTLRNKLTEYKDSLPAMEMREAAGH
jgi:DNA-binding NtrC family response regulator